MYAIRSYYVTVSKVQGIREFGMFSALGVLGALVISLTLVPICLTYLPAPRPFTARRQKQERRLAKMHELTMRYRVGQVDDPRNRERLAVEQDDDQRLPQGLYGPQQQALVVGEGQVGPFGPFAAKGDVRNNFV